jgi:enoyl-CoA hydratase/carnithine racemase
MDEFETIKYSVDDHLATITLARSEKRNAMNQTLFTELGEAAEMAGSDDDVRAVLVTGEGPSFCAGIDLSLLVELGAMGLDGDQFHTFVQLAQRPFRLLATMVKPTLAAVQGHAIGAGFQLALACDLRVAAGDASFAILEPRYGIIPDLGGAHHLARLGGPSLAKELVWSARTVEAHEAEQRGLVNRVVDGESLGKEAETFLREILVHSPVAIAEIKSLINGAHETPIEREFALEADAQVRCLQSHDHREAVAAFMEGRTPQFEGR